MISSGRLSDRKRTEKVHDEVMSESIKAALARLHERYERMGKAHELCHCGKICQDCEECK